MIIPSVSSWLAAHAVLIQKPKQYRYLSSERSSILCFRHAPHCSWSSLFVLCIVTVVDLSCLLDTNRSNELRICNCRPHPSLRQHSCMPEPRSSCMYYMMGVVECQYIYHKTIKTSMTEDSYLVSYFTKDSVAWPTSVRHRCFTLKECIAP